MWRGIGLSIGIALVGSVMGYFVPVIGSVIFSLIIGILLRHIVTIPESYEQGIKFSSKKILQWAIIVMGFTLSFKTAIHLGLTSLPITLFTITAALLFSYFIGKWMRINKKITTLIGVGTAICGGSAIAAVSPIIEADDDEIAFSMSTIFLFNIIAVFLFPFLGHLMNMTSIGFGYFAGAAINDTSSVVAAGYTYSTQAGDTATVVKLIRALMIVPICFLLLFIKIRKERVERSVQMKKIFPWFILYFFLATIFVTIVPLPNELSSILKSISTFMISIALAAIGLSVNIKTFKKIGLKPVYLGALTWLIVASTAIIMQRILNIW